MDKTININIGGSLFRIDEEAFRILRDYLEAINLRFRNIQGGTETVDDIESRIAEIFHSQKGLAGVITRENVESMILTMGKPGDFEIPGAEAGSSSYYPPRKRMYRNPDDTVIGGVCGGLGAYFNIDPVLLRILFVIFTVFFGVGFFIYIVLWIALPVANTPSKKREMYGTEDSFHSGSSGPVTSGPVYDRSAFGTAVNQVFSVFGRIFFVILRIFMIVLGICLVLAGFLMLAAFVMVFVFHFPGVYSSPDFHINVSYLPDFLRYVVGPSVAPWIIIMTILAVGLPLIALIYWGIRMIFWFRVRDGIYNLAGLVLWIVSLAVLTILLFNEGVSFAETSRASSQQVIANPPDTLYFITEKKIDNIKVDKQISLPDENYTVFLSDSSGSMYIKPLLGIKVSEDKTAKTEIRKRASARTRSEAAKKAEALSYGYRLSNDTIYLDEYFTIAPHTRWTGDFISVRMDFPASTVFMFDRPSAGLLSRRTLFNDEHLYSIDDIAGKFWSLSTDGFHESGTK